MILLLILVCSGVVVLCFACSLSEAVLLTLNPLWLKTQQHGLEQARRWLALKNRIERPIAAILIVNTLAGTGLATLAGAIFAEVFGASWMWLFSGVLAAVVLLGAELAPKILGVYHAEKLAPYILEPLTWILHLCHPLVNFMEHLCTRLKPAITPRGSSPDGRIMDIITLVQAARSEQALHGREEMIIIHAATLSARRVRHTLVPVAAMKCFQRDSSLLENVESVGPKLHRSYPVGSTGTGMVIEGYIRIRELFAQNLKNGGNADWRDLIRPVLRVDGSISLTQLLALFLEQQEIAALVQDEHAHLLGWVTMDDVMKVLMGQRV